MTDFVENQCIVCKRQIRATETDDYQHSEKQKVVCASLRLEEMMKKAGVQA